MGGWKKDSCVKEEGKIMTFLGLLLCIIPNMLKRTNQEILKEMRNEEVENS